MIDERKLINDIEKELELLTILDRIDRTTAYRLLNDISTIINNQPKLDWIAVRDKLPDELADDEKLFLACSFNDYDKEKITMCCDLFHLARALCAVCYDENMSGHDFMEFMDLITRVYIHKISDKEDNE